MRISFSILLLCAILGTGCVSGPNRNVKAFPVGDNWAQVSWTTDKEDANSIVQYGPTSNYGQVAQDDNVYTKHRGVLGTGKCPGFIKAFSPEAA